MNQNRLNRADLVEFAKNAAAQISAGKITVLLPEQKAAMAAALDAATADLAAADRVQVSSVAVSRQATEVAQEKQHSVQRLLQSLKDTLKGADAPLDEFILLGFDAPVRKRQRVRPRRPSNLAVTGFSNGVNVLKFRGNNVPGSVTYIIEARIGQSTEWAMIGISRKQSFRHMGVRPGVPILYRVRAEAARGTFSAYSNQGSIYKE